MELKIKYKNRNQYEWFIWFIFFMPFLFGIFTELLHFPSVIRYTVDAAWVYLLLVMIFRYRRCNSKEAIFLAKWVVVFFLYTIIIYLFNYQSVFYYLWGFRNNFRMYVFFVACIIFLYRDQIDRYMIWIDRLFYFNSLVAFIQFMFYGIRQDNLGGIFGVQSGCNGWLNIFQVIIVTKSVICYLNKKEALKSCGFKCGLALIIAAFAELKFFFVEFAIIVVLAVLITKFSWRKLIIIFGSIIGISMSVTILTTLFPNFADVMSIQGLFESASSDKGYTSSGDMNRLTSITMATQLFLNTSMQRVFGLGLGNCDYAETFSFLTTPFYERYSEFHYTWLSTAFVYLEMGIVGLIMFFGFFVVIYLFAHRREKNNQADVIHCQMARILSILCIVIGIYNSTLRTEAAYMLYFCLAIPFLRKRKTSNGLVEN